MQHPLFPEHSPPEGDTREFGFIRVYRQDRDGARNAVPTTFGPDDLTGIDQLFDAWGGGRYEVVAHEPNGRVLARQRYAFEGPSKPLAGNGDTGASSPEAPKTPAVGDPWTMMMGMMQMFMQMQQTQAQQQTQLVLALLNKGDANSNAHVQAMTQLYGQFGQTQNELLKQALASAAEHKGSSGGDSSQAFIKGLEYARELQDAAGGEGGDDLISTGLEFLAGMQSIRGGQNQQPPSNQTPPNGADS